MSDDPAEQLSEHPRFRWLAGMSDRRGRRVVDLDLWDGGVVDLSDAATAGALLALLEDTSTLSDVVRQDDDWIVAVDLPGTGLQGWAADSLGLAACYALLATYEALGGSPAES